MSSRKYSVDSLGLNRDFLFDNGVKQSLNRGKAIASPEAYRNASPPSRYQRRVSPPPAGSYTNGNGYYNNRVHNGAAYHYQQNGGNHNTRSPRRRSDSSASVEFMKTERKNTGGYERRERSISDRRGGYRGSKRSRPNSGNDSMEDRKLYRKHSWSSNSPEPRYRRQEKGRDSRDRRTARSPPRAHWPSPLPPSPRPSRRHHQKESRRSFRSVSPNRDRRGDRHARGARNDRGRDSRVRHIQSSSSDKGKRWREDDSDGGDSGGRNDDDSGKDEETHFRGREGMIIGEIYKLGSICGVGTFGKVLEADDKHYNRKVAIKIVRRVKRYSESARIEAEILRNVNKKPGRGQTLCVNLYDQFNYGDHCCLVFEKLGMSIYEVLKSNQYQGFPINTVRAFARQLLDAVDFLHSMHLIHTDLKTENVLLVDSEDMYEDTGNKGFRVDWPRNTKIKVIDFGGAIYTWERKSSIVNTRQYRAPEVILDVGWDKPSDVWCAGCIIAECWEGELLFATHDNMEHLALIEKCVGQFPKHMLKSSHMNQKYFNSKGKSRFGESCDEESRCHVQKMRPIREQYKAGPNPEFGEFLEKLLKIDPTERATPSKALTHEFITKNNDRSRSRNGDRDRYYN